MRLPIRFIRLLYKLHSSVELQHFRLVNARIADYLFLSSNVRTLTVTGLWSSYCLASFGAGLVFSGFSSILSWIIFLAGLGVFIELVTTAAAMVLDRWKHDQVYASSFYDRNLEETVQSYKKLLKKNAGR